jgi:hypothetical protein
MACASNDALPVGRAVAVGSKEALIPGLQDPNADQAIEHRSINDGTKSHDHGQRAFNEGSPLHARFLGCFSLFVRMKSIEHE